MFIKGLPILRISSSEPKNNENRNRDIHGLFNVFINKANLVNGTKEDGYNLVLKVCSVRTLLV